MRILSVLAAFACLSVISLAANGQPFSSDQYGFTAEFPADPVVGQPQAAETNAHGKVISHSVMIQTQVMGVYTAMVTVESYIVPTRINTGKRLAAMPRSFVSGLDAVLTSSKPGRLDGHRARFFTYKTRGHVSSGRGIAVVVPGRLPRTYLVLTNHTSLASDGEVAALDRFITSFQLK